MNNRHINDTINTYKDMYFTHQPATTTQGCSHAAAVQFVKTAFGLLSTVVYCSRRFTVHGGLLFFAEGAHVLQTFFLVRFTGSLLGLWPSLILAMMLQGGSLVTDYHRFLV